MTWLDPKGDLRVILSDGPTDKLRAYKNVFGMQNGSNTIFKTFEFRRQTDFSASATVFPLGVYFNGGLLAGSAISTDDVSTGYFQLNFGPTDADKLTTTYYIQWFLDAELDGFLIRASNWLGQDDNYIDTPSGLKTAALKYAEHEAYLKLSLKYSENIVETYRLEDSPDDKRFDIVKAYQDAAKNALSEAVKYRDDFYTRKGKALQPLFSSIRGNVKTPTIS